MEQYSPEQLNSIKQLRALKSISADSAYLKSLRAELLTRVAAEQPSRMTFVWHAGWRFALRAVVSIVCIGVIGFGAVFASQYVGPESILYPIKLAAEQAQITLGGDGNGTRADLRAKFAQVRLQEIQTLDQSNQLDTSSVQKALAQYQQHLRDLQTDLNQVASSRADTTLDQLIALEAHMQALLTQFDSVNATIQVKLQDGPLHEQAVAAQQTSLLTQEIIGRTILDFEANSGTFANDALKGARIPFAAAELQKQYEQVWGIFMDKVKRDTLADMKELSGLNTTISPEKGVSDIPDKDWDAYVALLDIKQRIARLRGMGQGSVQAISDDQYRVDLREYQQVRDLLAQIELDARGQ